MRKIILLTALTSSLTAFTQQPRTFTYDAAGNRIAIYVPTESAPEAPLFYAEDDIDDSIGTYVTTNDGCTESGAEPGDIKAKNSPNALKNKDPKIWKNGQVFTAPIWIGYRNKNTVYRIGYSAHFVQDKTQDKVHSITGYPRFDDYGNMYEGFYLRTSQYNPLSLWY